MKDELSLDDFIYRLAHKIATLYPNNCADEEDYIQAGHLKLVEINNSDCKKLHFIGYAIVSIARAMRNTALEATGSVSASNRVKKLAHQVEMFLFLGKTEQEIIQELNINNETFAAVKVLFKTYSWYDLFTKPYYEQEPFCAIDDILSSSYLDHEDKVFIKSQFNGINNPKMTRKQRWTRAKRIRHKLMRSGYGT